jgi:predicted CopG family antitoxin
MSRAELIPNLMKNLELFYEYSVQEGDTPESVAYKYYGDQYRYWIVLYCNGILDPQWEWPLNNQQFNTYIQDKYLTVATSEGKTVLEYTTTTVHHYEKMVISLDGNTLYQTTKNITIDEDTYTNLIEKTENVSINGVNTTYTISKKPVTIYDHELELNESKRNIKLIKSVYASEMERQLETLMAA